MALSRRGFVGASAALLTGGWTQASPGLREAAARTGRIFGCAVEAETLDRDSDFRALVARQAGLLVAENATKWDALRPAPDVFDFTRADRLAEIGREMGVPVRGHALLWHEALPAWFPKAPDRRTAERLLTEHIGRTVGHFAGRIAYWDVANEVIEGLDRRPDRLRTRPWLDAIGPGYLRLAYETAHQADPAARLSLNDYGLEYDDVEWQGEKRASMLALLKRLLAEGAPVHALGLQSHLTEVRPSSFGPALADFLARVADLGLEIWITELDADDQKTVGDRAARDQAVADAYARYLDVALRQPAVKMVTTWGLSDRYSSKDTFFARPDKDPQRPLPFDRDLKPKLAYDALMRAF